MAGERGPSGSPGVQGSSGQDGQDGIDGADGTNGARGPQGEQGLTGPQGPSGIASCPNGPCLSAQAATPGVQESGHINIVGKAIIGSGINSTTGDFSGDVTANDLIASGQVSALSFLQSGNVVCDNTGNCTVYQVAGNYFMLDGNSFGNGGVAMLGTNDTDELAFETGGTERMRIDGSGNVGIGTSAPTNTLTVKDTSDNAFAVIDDAGNEIFKIDSNEINQDRAKVVLDSNSIFIDGISSNGLKLGIKGGGALESYIYSQNRMLHLGPRDNQNALSIVPGAGIVTNIGNDANFDFVVKGATDSSLIWADAGLNRVGIGTANPESLLSMLADAGDAQFTIAADPNNTDEASNPSIVFEQDGGLSYLTVGIEGLPGTAFAGSLANAAYFQSKNSAPLQFAVGNTAQLTILNNGNLGIGTTNPGYKLDVNGDINIASGSMLRFGGTAAVLAVDGNGDLTTQGIALSGNLTLGGHFIGNSDTRGQVTVTAGTTSASYAFSSAYASAPHVVATPTSNPGAHYWISNVTTAGFTVNMAAAPVADVVFNFQVQQ